MVGGRKGVGGGKRQEEGKGQEERRKGEHLPVTILVLVSLGVGGRDHGSRGNSESEE